MILIISVSNSQQHPNLCNRRTNRGLHKHAELAILALEAFLRESTEFGSTQEIIPVGCVSPTCGPYVPQ